MKGNDKQEGARRVWAEDRRKQIPSGNDKQEGHVGFGGSRLPVGPLPGSRFALYFYCKELDRENVFLVLRG